MNRIYQLAIKNPITTFLLALTFDVAVFAVVAVAYTKYATEPGISVEFATGQPPVGTRTAWACAFMSTDDTKEMLCVDYESFARELQNSNGTSL